MMRPPTQAHCPNHRMKRQPVHFPDVKSIGFDPGTGILEIEFRSGEIREYLGASLSIYKGLIDRTTHDSYLRNYIRSRDESSPASG